MKATITIVNRTRHPIRVPGCQDNHDFSIAIGSVKVPFSPLSGTVACWTTFHPGVTVLHERITATYTICLGRNSPTTCGPLPAGLYHTVVYWPSGPPIIVKPGTLYVTVTK